MKAVTTMNRSSQSKRHPLHFLTEGTTMKYQEGAPFFMGKRVASKSRLTRINIS
jgi:hypothetical protein